MILESEKDPVLQEDLEKIIKAKTIPLEKLAGSTFLITGATGLIGSHLVKTLAAFNRCCSTNIKILPLVRSETKAKEVFGTLLERSDIKLVVGNILDDYNLYIKENKIDYLIHAASITSSSTMVTHPVETIITAINGTKNMLDMAKDKGCKSMVYISSMEMYGQFPFREENNKITENDIGTIDPLNIRSNYPESKRLCENLCVAYKSQYNVPVKIARLAQTFGAGVLKGENRVFAQFARSVINGEDIVLHTKGLSEGNYCYISDASEAILMLITMGENGEAYNIVNEESHIKIADMAQMVCSQIAENKIRVIYDIPEKNIYGYAKDANIWLSSEKMQKLGWYPKIGLEESYKRMIKSMRYTGV